VLSVFLHFLLVSQAGQPAATPAAYVPERVYDTRRQAFTDLEIMLADLAKADVVFVGEQHDDPNTHRLEAAILDGLRRRGVPVTLSLEMFERDTQGGLDAYLSGGIAEEEFLKSARPWPRYATDYRALVEMARTQGWAVIASNVPRRHASSVAKTGLGAVDTLPPDERAWVAADLQCPRDGYFDRFAETMKGHQAPAAAKPSASEKVSAGDRPQTGASAPSSAEKPPTADERATTERYYFSQCVKDETMAEAIAAGYERNGRKLVVHVNGAFHSDFGLGTAERVRRRLTDRRVAVVSVLPVKDLDTLAPAGDDLKRADYLVYTVAEPKK
jgi:uncharacterized iron-regulated protein